MNKNRIDVAIIGAGPYGLSIASYLRSHDVDFRIFGSPMQFWLNMTKGVTLKSPETATNIYTPHPNYRFVDYCRSRYTGRPPNTNGHIHMPVFAEYGLWVQRELVPEVEEVQVCRLERTNSEFVLTLSSGERVPARRVIVAIGLDCMKYVPPELEKLSPEAMQHSFQYRDYAYLAGKDVTVLGCGQSALEAAAMLHEYGAQTRILVRGNGIYYYSKGKATRWGRRLDRILNPNSVVGPDRMGWALEHAKTLTHYLPENIRVHLTKTRFGPAGYRWLENKIEGKVKVLVRTNLVHACERDGRVLLTVRDTEGEREIVTDHVVAGTGYVYSVDRVPFLSPTLSAAIDRIEDAPRLSAHFESSVKGLYFVGPLAAYSFGPLLRFVCGAEFAAPTVARHLAKTRRR